MAEWVCTGLKFVSFVLGLGLECVLVLLLQWFYTEYCLWLCFAFMCSGWLLGRLCDGLLLVLALGWGVVVFLLALNFIQ